MTLAVADAIMKWREAGGGSYDALSAEAIMSMQEFGHRYPRAVTEVTHNHPEGIRAKAESFLDGRLLETLHAFERRFCAAV